MPEKISSSSFTLSLRLIVCGAILCAAATAALAQSAPGQIRMVERENSARETANEERTRKRDPNEVMAEVNDDLRQLNQLNDAIALNTSTGSPQPSSPAGVLTNQTLNYDLIIGSAIAIKKRSIRLRTNLALPKADSKEKLPDFKEAEQGELYPALSALNNLLESFLHNPIFSDAGEIDMQLAAKARRDLDSIVVLSERVRKNAEKRSKTSNKQQ